MNKPHSCAKYVALLTLTLPLAGQATVFFADYFTNSSTLNQPVAAPTANSASYQSYIGTTNAGTVPGLNSGSITIAGHNTQSVLSEVLARFTSTPVALSVTGDYIEATVVFINRSNILSTAAGVTMNANATINIGLYNSAGVNPNQGQFAINHGAAMSLLTGGTEDWLGYIGRVGYSGNNAIITRPLQTPATTSNSRNQDLLFNNASGTQSFGEPSGSSVGGPAGSTALVQGATNTLYLKITLTAAGTLSVSNALFAGVGTGGTVVYGQERTSLTGSTFLTAGFDALAVGWRNSSSPGQGSAMDLIAVEVTGQSTVVTSPPDILTQPAPVTVPNGGSCAYWVVAQGFNMTYQWHRYGTNLVNGGNISGATSDTLILSPAGAADVASGANGYYVTITGTGGYSTNSVTNSLTLGAAKNLVWSGSGNIWDLATSANWLSGGNPATFNFGDAVTFDDTASGGIRLVTLTGKYLSASSVTVDGTSVYAFQAASTGGFAGPGSLIYKSSNQLTIGNVNTYSGGTLISNASAYLVLQNYDGLGTGPVTLAKAGGQMEITTAGSASLGIKGDVVVEDDFRILVDGTGSFATVFLGNLAGTAGKTLTLDPNDLSTTNRFRVYGNNTVMNANIVVNGPSTAEANNYGSTLAPYNGSGSQTYNGIISGNGGLIQRSSGTTILSGQNTYAGGTWPTTGTIGFGVDSTPTSGTVVSGPIGTGPLYLAPELPNAAGNGAVLAFGGARTIANPIQHPSATNNQTLVISGTNALTFTGPYTLNGTDGLGTQTNRIWQVDNTALTTISGVISDNGLGFGLTKTGTGTLVLGNTETYSGPTAVSNGTLRIEGQIGAGAVAVATNGTLGGSGTVSGPVTVFTGGRISPGSSIGTLTINNNLWLYGGGLNIEVNKSSGTTSDRVNVSGTLTNLGTGSVTITNLGPALAPGDSFTLFNKAVTGGNTMTVTGGSAIWINKLAVDGTIAVESLIASTPTNLNHSLAGNSLTLSWPPNYLTWSLQSNIVGAASSSNWFVVPNSGSTTQVVVTVNPLRSNVFYRLVAP